MKSSSSLFPVALIRAETIGQNLLEDTYLVKPNNSPDPSVRVAVTRVGAFGSSADRGVPVVLVHGSFSNNGFWLTNEGKGFAACLVEAGYDPWLVEMRGHGDSPVNQQYQSNCVEIYAQYDLPAIQQFIFEQTRQAAHWVGHSLGGVTIATAVAGACLQQDQVRSLVLFGAQVSRYPLLLRLPVTRLLARLFLLKKKSINSPVGPELEPNGVAREFVRWAGVFHGWRPKSGKSYWHGWREMRIPVLGFGAQHDKGDPAKYCQRLVESTKGRQTFYLLARKEGFSRDYGHVDMVVSKAAAKEVWPKVIDWLKQY